MSLPIGLEVQGYCLQSGTEGALKETGSGPTQAVTQNLAEWVSGGRGQGGIIGTLFWD